MDVTEEFTKRLLNWHRKNKRNFSWRRTKDPYKVLIAEIMLQKTDAEKVSEIYDRFIAKYPSVSILAEASLDELKGEMKLLGLHYRAERVKKIANEIATKYGGKVPTDRKKLLSLPGVGEYISNAVLCFAFGEDVPLVDTNVVRILNRALSLKSDKANARTDKSLWKKVNKIIPRKRGRNFNLALLDFAAQVCTAKNPRCNVCIMRDLCLYYEKRA